MKTEKKTTDIQLKEIMMASLFIFKKALENVKTGVCDNKFLEQMDSQFSDLRDFLFHLERDVHKPYLEKYINDSLAIIVTKTWELDRYNGDSLILDMPENQIKRLFPWSGNGHHEELDCGDGITFYVDDGSIHIYFRGKDSNPEYHSRNKEMTSVEMCSAFVKKHNIKLDVSGILGPYKHAEDMLKKFGLI